MRKILGLLFFGLFLSGCYSNSLTMVGPATGVASGKLSETAASTSLNYVVKQKTGKYPIEHVLKREKQRIIKKATEFENKVIKVANKTITTSKDTVLPIKNSFSDKVAKLNGYMLKDKTFSMKNFKHKPRFSYKPK